MRRVLPVVLLLAFAAVGWLAYSQHWLGFGAGGGSADRDAGVIPEELDAAGKSAGLSGTGKLKPTDADPKEIDGEPVGVLTFELGKASLEGRVVEVDGTPIRFARIEVVLAPPNDGRGLRTKKDGTFEIRGLPAGDFDLRAAAEAHVARTVRTPPLGEGAAADTGDIALKPRLASKDGIEVKVVEAGTGRPVAGAKVIVSTLGYGLVVTLGAARAGVPDVIQKETVTDDLGIARFAPLPAERYDVIVHASNFVLEAVENVIVAANRVERVNVKLKPGLSARGTVVDLNGAPVAGAYVTCLGLPSFRSYDMATTDGAGTWTLDGLMPGGLMVMAGHEARGTGQAMNVKAGDMAIRIQLKGVGTIQGKVVRKGGTTPVTSFLLRPYTSGPFQYVYSRPTTFTDPDGRFKLVVPPGSYLIDAKLEGASVTTTPTVTVGAGETKELTIELPAEGVVRGVVTDAGGDHLAGAEVFVKSGGFPPMPIREQYVRTDADGKFELKGLALTPVKIHVRHAASAAQVVETTPMEPGKGKELTIRLTEGARVEGRVTTEDGAPVVGERINLAQGFDFFGAKTAFSDANGAYVFRAVAAGDYQVTTGRFENAASGQQKKASVPAEGVVVVDFKAEGGDGDATGVVRGVVTVGTQPQAGASIFASDDRGTDAGVSATTDATGHYEVRGLKAGKVRLQFQTQDGSASVKTATIDKPGGEAVLDVSFGGAGIAGVLVGSDGRTTASGAWVQAELHEDGAPAGEDGGWGRVKAFASSSNDGSFKMPGLEPGRYRVRITPNSGGYATKVTAPFDLAAGETKDLGRVQLAAGGGISGTVTEDASSPLEGVGVSLEDSKGEKVFLFSFSSTGSNGRYTIEGVELGTYTVIFDKKGYAPARKSASLAASGGSVVDAVLRRGGAIAATVEDGDGKPVAGARIELTDEAGKRIEKTFTIVNVFDADVSRTNDAGTATIPDLPPGTYVVKAIKEGYVLFADPVRASVSPGGTATVKVILRKAP